MALFGPTFISELTAAGCLGLAFSWSDEGIFYDPSLDAADKAKVEAVVAAHDPTKVLPTPVPRSISDRQFAQALAAKSLLTQQEALDFVKSGSIPTNIQTGIDGLPDADTRFRAEMLICGATSFERANPMVPILGQILGLDSTALDGLWILGATF